MASAFAADVSRWANRTFDGVIRPDGRVGTANYWLIIPLVFCENRNALKLRDALERTLGYAGDHLADFARSLVGGTGCAPAPRGERRIVEHQLVGFLHLARAQQVVP